MSSPPESHFGYRPDIDGLRAIAVLSVVWYHAFPNWGRGGFVGVDIFFVISGFLISTNIFDRVAAGNFSVLDFYDRRIRRIFPALIVVLLACLVVATTMAFPKDSRQIGKHIMGGAGFASNFVLWSEAGYFDFASELKPLLHLWSLSVEEQYYIFWPLLVMLLFKRPRWFIAATVFLLVASFALNIVLLGRDPVAAFYLPGGRAWELLVGSVLAYVTRVAGTLPSALSSIVARVRPAAQRSVAAGVGAEPVCVNVLGWAGAALLAAAILITTRHSVFPGWWALLPTLGAFCLIGAGPTAWFNQKVLSNSVAVFVGRISYPLYLWHWPLLVFPNVIEGSTSRTTRLVAVVASFVLAWLTYSYVEKPVRYGRRRASMPFVLTGAMGALAACGALLIVSDGWVQRYPVDLRDIATAEFKYDAGHDPRRHCFLAPEHGPEKFGPECLVSDVPGIPDVWLWGDSHAAHLYPGLRKLLGDSRRFELTQMTASACPPIHGFELAQRPHCRKINDAVLNQIEKGRPHTVLLAANWSHYDGQEGREFLDMAGLQRTVARLIAAGVGRVVVVGQQPRWEMSQPMVILKQWRESGVVIERGNRYINRSAVAVDDVVRRGIAATGVEFLSPIKNLCNAVGCLHTVPLNGSTFPVAWDDAHLTDQASEVLAKRWQRQLLGELSEVPFR